MNLKHNHRTVGHRSPTYSCWESMNSRCNNKKSQSFYNYGGRGIKVCKEWKSFLNFLEDMGERPSQDHTLDRIDVNKGYFKENCKWSTRKEQANNRRNTCYVLPGLSVSEFAAKYDLVPNTVYYQLRQGYCQWPQLRRKK